MVALPAPPLPSAPVPPLLVWALLALAAALTPLLFARGLRFSSLATLTLTGVVGLISGSPALAALAFGFGLLLMGLLHLGGRWLLLADLELLIDRALRKGEDEDEDEEDDDDWRRGDDDGDDEPPPDPGAGPAVDWSGFDRLRAGWGRLPLR